MNSPSSASPSWPESATLASNLGGAAAAQTGSSVRDVITIEENSVGKVYNIETRGKPDKPFDMEFKPANDSVQVKSFAWYISNPTMAKPETRSLTENAEAGVQNGILFQRFDANDKTFVCLNVTDVDKDYHKELNKAMVIGIRWTIDKQEGETLSRAFSITPNNDEQVKNDVWGKVQNSYYNIAREESIHSGGSGGHNGFTPPNNSSDDKNSTGNGISDITTIGGNSSALQTHNRGRGGLGTGAIAGIAVGVAALLAAALGIIFFLRRRRGRGTPSTTALHHTHAAEHEKLSSFAKGGVAGGGASASDAAIAPYRDDNSTLTNSHDRRRSSAATGRVLVAPGEDVVARDQQPSPPKTTSNGVSRHLVEDGMTAEDIRRLEEEEAQLDDEILRANGRRR
ncbi:hypothetical protein MY10362_000768 [Beauveria mimosiformis]